MRRAVGRVRGRTRHGVRVPVRRGVHQREGVNVRGGVRWGYVVHGVRDGAGVVVGGRGSVTPALDDLDRHRRGRLAAQERDQLGRVRLIVRVRERPDLGVAADCLYDRDGGGEINCFLWKVL